MQYKSEAERLIQALQRLAPNLNTSLYFNGMTQAYEVVVNGGDPRGVKVWLRSPLQAMRYVGRLRTGEIN